MAITTIQQVLDAQTPRVYDLGQNGVVLSYTTDTFIEETSGTSPATITIKALLGGTVTGTVTWSTNPSITTTVSGNTVTVAQEQLALSSSVIVTATIVSNGVTYTDSVSLSKQPGSTKILNSNISINANGTLSGASGTGQVTISGLGYTGDLDATKGAPAGTLVNGVPVATITTAVTNFNNSNDRNSAAVVAPSVATDGTAIDHSLQTDGSADVSFEWSWGGSEGDIDGFRIYVYTSSSSGEYAFGTTTASETVYEIPASKRAFILYGVAANQYYTIGVQAYRAVDKDINSTGVITSTIVKSTRSEENPYRPSATVAFAGNVTGTVNSIAATDINVWNAISGTGKPQDNANATSVDSNGQIQNVTSGAGTSVNNALVETTKLLASGSVVVSGVTVLSTTAIEWGQAQVYSKEGYAGGAFVSFVVGNTSSWFMAGLNTASDLTDAGYTTIDFAFYFAYGTLQIYESGTYIGSYGSYAVGDSLSIVYDGFQIYYYKNGSLLRTRTKAVTGKLFFDSSFASSSTNMLSNIKFSSLPIVNTTAKNYADTTWWSTQVVSSAITTQYNSIWSPNAGYNQITTSRDALINKPSPLADVSSDYVWYLTEPDSDGNTGGGWNTELGFNLDPTKTYRFVVPVMKLSGGDGSGSFYWGTYGVCDLNTVNTNTNPYFYVNQRSQLVENRWYLMIGYVFPYGSTNNTHEGAGLIDTTTGLYVASGLNYAHTSTGAFHHRAYQYYANAGNRQVFGRPEIYEVNGSEPPISRYITLAKAMNASVYIDATTGTINNISTTGSGTVVANSAISVTGGAIQGIGTGSGTVVANSAISVTGGAIQGIGTGSGTVVANSAISVTDGAIQGIGTGSGTAVANTAITVTSGAIQGIGTGSGTAVANNQITLSSSGTLNNAGGGTVLVGGSGNINTLSGSLNVGTLGSVIGGKANYSDSTAGFFLGYDSSAYKLKIGNSTKYLQWDGTDLTVQGNITGSVITGTSIETQVGTNSSKIFIGKSDGTQNPNANQIYITTGAASPYDVGIRIGGSNGRGIITTGVPSSGYALSAYGYSVTSIYAYNGNEGGSWSGNAINAVSANPSEATVYVTKLPGASGASGGYGIYVESNNPNCETFRAVSDNVNVGGHAIRGYNKRTGSTPTTGLIGPANGFDFYADGTGQYGPFTGSHDALLAKNATVELGDIVADVEVVHRNGISSTIASVALTTQAMQKGVVGVVATQPQQLSNQLIAAYCNWINDTQVTDPKLQEHAESYDHITINALGEGQVQVCGLGGNLEPGDLIVSSSIPGKGQKQTDDIVRSITVAKCRETVVFDYPEQVKLVACIYLCG